MTFDANYGISCLMNFSLHMYPIRVKSLFLSILYFYFLHEIYILLNHKGTTSYNYATPLYFLIFKRTHVGIARHDPVINTPWITFSINETRTVGGDAITEDICLDCTKACLIWGATFTTAFCIPKKWKNLRYTQTKIDPSKSLAFYSA